MADVRSGTGRLRICSWSKRRLVSLFITKRGPGQEILSQLGLRYVFSGLMRGLRCAFKEKWLLPRAWHAGCELFQSAEEDSAPVDLLFQAFTDELATFLQATRELLQKLSSAAATCRGGGVLHVNFEQGETEAIAVLKGERARSRRSARRERGIS